MSNETIKQNIRRVFEVGLNQRNMAVFDELLSPSYVNRSMPAPGSGPESMKGVVAAFVNAFPDLQVTLNEVMAEGDRVATRGTITGTHQGDFQGIPPTGKQIQVEYIDIWRADERGKFAENWVQIDMLGMMQQLGVIPAPA